MRKRLYIIIIGIFLLFSAIPVAYARYIDLRNLRIQTNTGYLLYDVSIDTSDTYIDEFGVPYFNVTITNNKNNELTKAPFDYQIVISNKSGSTGKYNNSNTSEIGTYSETLTINGSFGNQEIDSNTYKIFVECDSYSDTTIDYNLDYYITQSAPNN